MMDIVFIHLLSTRYMDSPKTNALQSYMLRPVSVIAIECVATLLNLDPPMFHACAPFLAHVIPMHSNLTSFSTFFHSLYKKLCDYTASTNEG